MKKNKILYLLLIVGLFLSFTTGCGNKEDDIKKDDIVTDAMKFKEEYETLNGTENSSGQEHRTLSIPEDNPFIYATAEEIVEKIENEETFYVYFGSSYCPWCRSVIEKAIEIANKNNIDTIYYVDIWDGDHVEILRDTYTLDEDGELQIEFEGTSAYKDLLKYFDNVLGDYTLTDEDGDKVSVGEKRIFAPNFIYVEEGKAIKLVEGISENQTNSRMKLTDEILEDQEKQFTKLFKK